MAKAEKGEQKANLYLLAIVAIVAVVGIVVLVLNSGGVSLSTDDLSGQVTAAKTATATTTKMTAGSLIQGTLGVDSACPACPTHCTCGETSSGACIQLCDE